MLSAIQTPTTCSRLSQQQTAFKCAYATATARCRLSPRRRRHRRRRHCYVSATMTTSHIYARLVFRCNANRRLESSAERGENAKTLATQNHHGADASTHQKRRRRSQQPHSALTRADFAAVGSFQLACTPTIRHFAAIKATLDLVARSASKRDQILTTINRFYFVLLLDSKIR